MSDFDQIQFNTKAFSELTALLKTKRFPNALLFYGKMNTRKKEAALFLAKGANCLEPEREIPCDQCNACNKINTRLHPDIYCVEPQKGKKNITIAQIREMTLAVATKPNEAKLRVVIISDADLMNTQAQNALLKLLEEPPEKTMFILVAQKETRLLDTILSRCRKLRFHPMTEALVRDHLTDVHQIESQMAHIMSKTTAGDLQKALIYLNLNPDEPKTDWIKRRQWILKGLADLVGKKFFNISQALVLSQKICSTPDLIADTLALMKTFFRDLSIFRWSPEKIINLDFSAAYADIIEQAVPQVLHQGLELIYETEKRLLSNSNPRLTLDRFFINLAFNKGSNT